MVQIYKDRRATVMLLETCGILLSLSGCSTKATKTVNMRRASTSSSVASYGNSIASFSNPLSPAAGGTVASTASAASAGSAAGVVAIPFSPVPARSYVAKIKQVLTSLPPNATEVDAVASDPSALTGLIDTWLTTPQAQQKLLGFFGNAFQQSHLDPSDHGGLFCLYFQPSGDTRCGTAWPQVTQNFTESFPRTAWQLAMVENQPWTSVLTTTSFMMTTAVLVNTLHMNDPTPWPNTRDWFAQTNYYDVNYPGSSLYYGVQNQNITTAESLDPTSPYYQQWYYGGNSCAKSVSNYPLTGDSYLAWQMINGFVNQAYDATNPTSNQYACTAGNFTNYQYAASDFEDWRMVQVRTLKPGELMPRDWDLPTLRTLNSVGMRLPRIGFFTTPAFLSNWATNHSNQYRGVMNQTLIVALGYSLNGSSTVALDPTGGGLAQDSTDASHADNPACAACHNHLDPMRNFFASTYNVYGFVATIPSDLARVGNFSMDGVQSSGNTLANLASALAADPNFAPGWVQKVCYWVNSAPCDTTDPIFLKIASDFANNQFNFRSMLVELLASPLATGAASTQTWAKQGETVSIARNDHFCQALQNRLEITGPCAMSPTSGMIPAENFTRGYVEPFQPSQMSLFLRASYEQVCTAVAGTAVDATGAPYLSTDPQPAMVGLVQNLMGVMADDPRYSPLLQALQNHYTEALSAEGSASIALQSTFVLACTSPLVIGVGI